MRSGEGGGVPALYVTPDLSSKGGEIEKYGRYSACNDKNDKNQNEWCQLARYAPPKCASIIPSASSLHRLELCTTVRTLTFSEAKLK